MNRNGEIRSEYDVYHIEESIRSLPCIKDVALTSIRVQNKNHIRCIFTTNHNSKNKLLQLVEKITEQATKASVINFSAHKADKTPYTPGGKICFREIIKMMEENKQTSIKI